MTTKRVLPGDIEIGKRLRSRRLMQRMSQTQLGDAIGVSFQQVQKYENGTNRIGGSRIEGIANALKCQPSFLFGGESKGDAAVIEAALLINRPDTRRMLLAFNRINGSLRPALADLMEAIADQVGTKK